MSGSQDPNFDPEDGALFVGSDDEDAELVEELDERHGYESDQEEEPHSPESQEMDSEESPVFQPRKDDSIKTFKGHTDAVYAVEISASGQLIVSGGKDDRGWLWNSAAVEILELTGFKDSVTHVGFSQDEKFVMAADMSGKVQVWEIGKRQVVFNAEVDDIMWTAWHPTAAVLVAGTLDGTIWLWMIPHGHTKSLQSFGEASTFGKFLSDGKRITAGYADGSIRLWDLKSCQCQCTISKLSEYELVCLDVNSSGVVATGSRSGLNFSSIVTGKPILSLNDLYCVESVQYSSNNCWLAAGDLNGTLLIWDVAAGQQRHRISLEGGSGVCKLAWAGSDHILVASLDGITREYDARSGEMLKSWEGHTSILLDLSVGKSSFATSSEDRTVKLFDYVVT